MGVSDSTSWVPVREEPNHRGTFENDYTYVYSIDLGAGTTTLLHQHTRDTAYVYLSHCEIASDVEGEERSTVRLFPGLVYVAEHAAAPFTHVVSNVGSASARMIGAELLAPPRAVTEAVLDAPFHELTMEHERVRAYALELGRGEQSGPVLYGFSGLTVVMESCTVEIAEHDAPVVRSFEPGDVLWHDGPIVRNYRNVGEHVFRARILEWR